MRTGNKHIIIHIKPFMAMVMVFIVLNIHGGDIFPAKQFISVNKGKNKIPVLPSGYDTISDLTYYLYTDEGLMDVYKQIDEKYENGHLIERMEWDPGFQEFVENRSYVALYNDSGKILDEKVFLYNTGGFVWEQIEEKTYSYAKGVYLLEEKYRKNVEGHDTLFTTFYKRYTYDNDDTLRESISMTRDTITLLWVNNERVLYTYVRSENKTIKTIENWDDMAKQWNNSFRVEEIYAGNKLFISNVYEWVDKLAGWIGMVQEEYNYAGGLLVEKNTRGYDIIEMKWVNASRESYEYGAENIEAIRWYYWDNFKNTFVNNENLIYDYSNIDYFTVINQKLNIETKNWYTSVVYSSYFDETQVTTTGNRNEDHQFEIYPNPAVDFIYVKNAGIYQDIDVQVINIAGASVENIDQNNNCIYIGKLARGLYIVRGVTKNGEIYKAKFIKK